MSIASEITRISGNIADAYTSLNAKGATMPATQNSANLADTIDSVPTGGGGGTPAYMTDFNNMATILEGLAVAGSQDSRSASQFLEDGYTVAINSGYRYNVLGFVYDETVPFVITRGDVFKALKIPSTASYEIVDSNKYKVTFTTERWIIVNTASPQYFTAIETLSKITSASGSEYEKLLIPVAVYQYRGSSNDTLDNIYGTFNINKAEGLKYFKFKSTISNITQPTSSGVSAWQFLLRLDNIEEILPQFAGYDTNLKMLIISGSSAKDICGLASSSQGIYNVLNFMKTGTSIIFDLSSLTTTGTANFFPSANNYCTPVPTIRDLKIKLPSTYSTVNLTYKVYNSSYGLDFTHDALKFLADNAPTVTSCTLKLGYMNYGYLNYTTEGQTILSTFTSKGWTISTV